MAGQGDLEDGRQFRWCETTKVERERSEAALESRERMAVMEVKPHIELERE